IAAGSCSIRDCVVRGNGAAGISGGAADIHGCTAIDNKGAGISGEYSSTIRECSVWNNGGDGIAVMGNCCVLNNNCSANKSAGVRVAVGQFNRIESNHVSQNQAGIVVQTAFNVIIHNSAFFNSLDSPSSPGPTKVVNYDVVSGNSTGPSAFGGLEDD